MAVSTASNPTVCDSCHTLRTTAVEEAEQRLRESPYFALRTLRCDYHEGILTVRGRVPSFYARQVAVETLRRVKAIEQLVDRIEVE